MSPASGKANLTGAVYVLARYVHSRPVVLKPTTNAERPDTDFFYADGIYDLYPARKAAYEERRRREDRKTQLTATWAKEALETVDTGKPLPPTQRPALSEVLMAVYWAGPKGVTRAEICAALNRDGGKVSGVLTDLHAAGIIYMLEGVRR